MNANKSLRQRKRDEFLDMAMRRTPPRAVIRRQWRKELAERALWDATLADGLEDR